MGPPPNIADDNRVVRNTQYARSNDLGNSSKFDSTSAPLEGASTARACATLKSGYEDNNLYTTCCKRAVSFATTSRTQCAPISVPPQTEHATQPTTTNRSLCYTQSKRRWSMRKEVMPCLVIPASIPN